MILNFSLRLPDGLSHDIEVVDVATGASLNHLHIAHADEAKATYRVVARDPSGRYILEGDPPRPVVVEYYCPIRFEPRRDLSQATRELVGRRLDEIRRREADG
jgi:hypothetical protein